MAVEIKVPALGESVTEATIAKWFKAVGDAVAVDEALVELETDKVTVEVNAPVAGALKSIAAAEGADVAVGAHPQYSGRFQAARRSARGGRRRADFADRRRVDHRRDGRRM